MRIVRLTRVQRALSTFLLATALWTPSFFEWADASANQSVVKKLQFHEVNAITRIVLDLDSAPRDLTILDTPGKPMTVSFRGILQENNGQASLQKFNWPNLSGVYIENRNGRVQLFIKRNMVGSVTVKTEGARLVVNVPHFYYKVNDNNEVAAGVRHTQFTQKSAQGPVQINVLEIDPKNPGVEIAPVLAANKMGARADVASMVANNQAIAGINGSFFKPDVGTPLGILIINQELVSGPIYDRVALGISGTNSLFMAQIQLVGEVLLPNGRKLPIHNVNQPRVEEGTTVVYTARWGKTAPKLPTDGIQIQLRNNQVMAVSTTEPLPIPQDGVVISGPATADMLTLSGLSSARTVPMNIYTLPDWSGMKHAIGGGPWLVRDGRAYVDVGKQHFSSKSLGTREPRSAVGITHDGKLLLVTVDGRKPNVSVGMTLYEMSHLMQKLGSVHAMNLDGGSSTQMAVYGQTVNIPSAGKVGVSNSLIVRRTNGDNVAVQNSW